MSYVNNNGIQIYFQVVGEGPPLVLHHGFSDSLLGWFEYGYVEALRDQYQLILIDGRGHGGSDKPHDPDAYGMAQRAGDVTAVLDALAIEQAHYFGYSLGGWTGFALARHAPERIRSLILGGIHPYGQRMDFYREATNNGIGAWSEIVRTVADPLDVNVGRFLANDVVALAASVASDRPNISMLLPSMTMPCLLFAGEADPLYPFVERCSRELPNARFFPVPALNHIQTILHSDLVLPHVLRFLAEVTPSPAPQRVEKEDQFERGGTLYLWQC